MHNLWIYVPIHSSREEIHKTGRPARETTSTPCTHKKKDRKKRKKKKGNGKGITAAYDPPGLGVVRGGESFSPFRAPDLAVHSQLARKHDRQKTNRKIPSNVADIDKVRGAHHLVRICRCVVEKL